MALPTQNLFIPLGTGVRRDIDPHVFPVGKSGLVFNGVYDQLGQIVKRPGSFGLSTARASGAGQIGATWQLATYRNSLVSLSQGPTTDPIDVYSPTIGRWASATAQTVSSTAELSSGRMGPVGVGLIPLTGDAPTATNIPGDIAISGGYLFTVHTTSSVVSPVTTFYAIDAATNRTVYRWTISGNATFPRVIALNGYVAVFYFNTVASIIVSRWQISALSGPPSVTTLVADALGIFDTTASSATVASMAYRQNTNQLWRVDLTMSTGAVSTTQITTAAAGSINPSLAISWINDLGASGKLSIATAGPAGLQEQWDITGGTPTTTYVLDPTATVGVLNICGHTISSNATGETQVLYDFGSTVKLAQRTVSGGVASGTWANTVGLSSKTFNATQPHVLVCYVSASARQPTYFLMPVRSDALTANTFTTSQARIAVWSAVPAVSGSSNLPNVGTFGAIFMTPVAVKRLGNGNPTAIGIATVQWSPTLGKPAEAADGLLIPGGTSTFFDGLNLGSFDFDVYPETPSAVPAGGAGLSVGIYTYQVVYAKTDANGRVARSAPSLPTTVTIVGGPNQAADVTYTPLRLTNIPAKVEIYRGVVNTTTPLQLIASIDNTGAASGTFHDTVSDVTAASGDPIYTTGGVLEHDPIPGLSSVIVAQNRAFGISMDDPTEIWVSNEFTNSDAISFNEAFIIKIADENGPLVGLGVIDDKIIAIKAAAVYAFNGDGPDPLGRGGFSTPQIIARGVGISNPQSIVAFPDGLAFSSTATTRGGIQLIDRSLAVRIAEDGSTFGSAVKADTDSFPVVASCVVPQLSQARWYLTNGIVCVYDYVRGAWTEFFYAEGAPAITSAAAYNGTAVRSTSGAVPIMADAADLTFPCTDNGVAFFFTIETPWIQLAGVQGFERLMKIQGSGATTGTHVLTVQVFADFDRSAAVGSYSGTPGVLWDWELVPRSQRNRAFLIRIADNNSGTAGPSVAGITMRLGLYQGLAQKSSGRRLRA